LLFGGPLHVYCVNLVMLEILSVIVQFDCET